MPTWSSRPRCTLTVDTFSQTAQTEENGATQTNIPGDRRDGYETDIQKGRKTALHEPLQHG